MNVLKKLSNDEDRNMTEVNNYLIDVRFEIPAPAGDIAIEWLSQELRSLNYSDFIEYWTIKSVIEESALDEDEED